MGIIRAFLEALIGLFSFGAAREKNLPTRELEELDEEAAELRLQIGAAADSGNTVQLSELQNRLAANYARRKALRPAAGNEGGKRD